MSTIHGSGGPGRAVRCHSEVAVPLMAMPPTGVQVPLCQVAGLFCTPYRVGSRVSHPSWASSCECIWGSFFVRAIGVEYRGTHILQWIGQVGGLKKLVLRECGYFAATFHGR